MATPAVLTVSIPGIKAIGVDILGAKAYNIMEAIFVINTTIFIGTPPITLLVLTGLITNYNLRRSAYIQGGLSLKKPYQTALSALRSGLCSLAPFVDDIAVGNEDTLKMSMLPYSAKGNDTGDLIRKGALPTGLVYSTGGITGSAIVSCKTFGKNAKYIAIAVQNEMLPDGTTMTADGQIILPSGFAAPSYIININGKRVKSLVNMIPKMDYYLYYVMMFGVNVSGLSLPLKIASKN